MKSIFLLIVAMIFCASSSSQAAGDYRGDERCRPPNDWSRYSPPYNPAEHPQDYPVFYKADWPGWSCSYQREDGVVVQYGDSRTPQEQWLATWGGDDGR